MTGSVAIVLAPWLVFAVGVTAICLRLGRSRHPSCRLRLPRRGGRRARVTTTEPGADPGVVSPSEEAEGCLEAEGCQDGARPS